MHLIGFGLKPLEKSPDAIIIRRPFNDGFFLGLLQTSKRQPGGNFFLPAEDHQIFKFHAVLLDAAKGLDGARFKGKTAVRDDEIKIDINGSAKPPAGFAGPHRTVKGKEVWDGRIVGNVASGADQSIAKGKMLIGLNPDIQSADTKMKRLFQGIHDSFSISGSEKDSVCDNMNFFFGLPRLPSFQRMDLTTRIETGETYAAQLVSQLFR